MGLPRFDRIEDAVLVTHRSCMDGAGSALLFIRAGGKRENIRYVSAGMLERFVKTDKVFNSGAFLIFCDIGFNAPEYAARLDRRGNCVLLDHHKTSLHMQGRPWADIRMDACGTELLRQYLGLDDLGSSYLAGVIDSHDRWLTTDVHFPLSTDLACFVSFVGQKDFVNRFADGRPLLPGLFTPFERDMTNVVIRRRDEQIANTMKHVRVRDVDLSGRSFKIGYVVSDDPNTSLLLNRLLETYPDVQAACQVMVGHAKVSLRSRGDFDVSTIAQLFGGGGHAAASGHLIDDALIDELISEVHRG